MGEGEVRMDGLGKKEDSTHNAFSNQPASG